MSRASPGKVIFLGDIPYEMSEDEIQELAGTAGPVLNFRLIYNNETKKSRGFAFIEYPDVDVAIGAVQKFNNMPLKGRVLRADYSHEKSGGSFFTNRDGGQNRGNNQGNNGYRQQQQQRQQYPQQQQQQQQYSQQKSQNNRQQSYQFQEPEKSTPAPPNTADEIPPSLIFNDSISRTLSHLPPPRLLELISTLKILVSQDTMAAREYFNKNSEVTYAVVQAMLLMGLVDAKVVTEAAQMPSGAPPPSQYPVHHQQPRSFSTPPPPPPPPSDPLANIDPQQAALIKQVLELTDDQISYLPADQKSTILALRDRYRRGLFS